MKKISFTILTLIAATFISFATDTVASKKVTIPSRTIKSIAPTAPKTNFDFLPPVVAEVNGKKFTKIQLIQKLLGPKNEKAPSGVTQEMLKNAAKGMATQFIESTAILNAAIKAGFKPSAELAVKEFNDFLKKAPPFQVEQIKKGLAKQSLTIKTFIEKNKTKKQFQEQMATNAFIEAKVLNKCVVSDKEVKAYYDANPKAFKIKADAKDSMRASHILIVVKEKTDAKTKAAAKAKVEKLLALLKKDVSLFGELAEKESQCPSSRNKGSLGVFTKGRMVPEFEQAVVSLKAGEISGIVETKFGYHIIRRDVPQKAKTKTFAEVKGDLKIGLKQKKTQKTLMAFVKKITEDANGKIYIN